MKTYDSYVRRAKLYELIGLKKKAIEVMKEIVDQPYSNLEKGSGYIYIGLMYRDLKELTQANKYFELALNLCKEEQYFYSSNFKKIIECFLENGESVRAFKWYNHLLERESYDKQFSKLKVIKLN